METAHKKCGNQEQKKASKRTFSRFDRDTIIIHCMTMRLSEAESLAYLEAHGHKIKRSAYYEDRKRLEESVIHKAYKIAAENGLIEQHMQRINQLETIEREHWQNYHREKAPLKKSIILEKITVLQPYLSSAYDYVKQIIKEQAEVQARLAKTNQEPRQPVTPSQ